MFARLFARFTLPAASLLWAGALAAAPASASDTSLPIAQLAAGIHVIHAEVAQTEDSRRTGLMHRESMKPNDGMLFIFEAPDQHCFWMRNTLIPLSIAFIADDGKIMNLADMAPQSTDTHCSKGAVRYALEMNQGWFAERGITAGSRIQGLP